MTQFSADGKDAIRSAIRELTDAGYITRAQTHSEAGTFSGYDYLVHETPAASPSSGFPTMEKPTTENPTTENPTLRNTEELSTIPPIVPQSDADGANPSVSLAADTSPVRGGKEGEKGEAGERGDVSDSDTPPKRKRRATKSAPDYRPDTFARFWAAYPRGEDKQGAIAAWDELKPDDATLQAMSRALVRQRASEEWQRGIGIPYAVRWLRRRRWEDEIKAPAPPPERAGGDLPVWN